ncbi:hypothetical protein [Tahibacter amnicola]|uniref:Oligosaccharide repeat unit polymerase n=1 Tax=Tahibacter amnicola TaxID=2976241 RepID=A0ABY6BB58_9GAMM|nr:hypothetical protein [Tahibacter amnicola]UXI66388.1 hypothetical protein N4264_16720 [Tahibacter amnicola]
MLSAAVSGYPREHLHFRSQHPGVVHVLLTLPVISVGTFLAFGWSSENSAVGFRLYGLVGLLIAYGLAQIVLVRASGLTHWALNPSVQFALLGNLLPATAFILLSMWPDDLQRQVRFDPTPDIYRIQYEWLNLIGASALWTGHWSGTSRWLAEVLARTPVLARASQTVPQLRRSGLAAVLALVVGARLLAISLGLYGYSSSYEQAIAASAYNQYLALADDLGIIVLVAVSLTYFSGRCSVWLLIAVWATEELFGFMSGFKSAVVAPVVVVGMAYYVQRNRLPLWLLPVSLTALLLAYMVIEPFREYRNRESSFEGTSVTAIVNAFSAGGKSSNLDNNLTQTATNFLNRVQDVTTAAAGIEYAAKTDILPAGSPQFLADIFYSPLYSFVPRAIWQGKPINDLGVWYTQVVLGMNSLSSTGMSPVTYLNFAGGAWAVALGFLVVGLFQSAIFRALLLSGGAASFLIVGLTGALGHVDSVFYAFFIAIARYVPLLLVMRFVLFRSPNSSRHFHRD